MVVLFESDVGADSNNVATAHYRIPALLNRQHTLRIVNVTLPRRPVIFQADNQVASDTGEQFSVPNCASFAELAVALSDLRHVDTSRVLECYATNEVEFEVCTFNSVVTLDATLAAQLNLSPQLAANTCYSAAVHVSDVDECHATRIIVDGCVVQGMIEAGSHTNVVAQYGTTLQQTSAFQTDPTNSFSVSAQIVMKDGTVQSYPVSNTERFSFGVEIV